MFTFEGMLATIVVLGAGAIVVALMLQRARVQQAIQAHAASVAETLIAQLRSDIAEARKEIISLRENVQVLTAQLEAMRIDTLKEATSKELSVLRAGSRLPGK